MKQRKVYKFRLKPTVEQEQGLLQQAGCRRFIWNWALSQKSAYYREHKKGLPTSVVKAQLPVLKAMPDLAWLKDADSQVLQEVIRDLDKAFANFFAKRAKYPKFKSRKNSEPSFRISQRVTVEDGFASTPKVGHVKVRQSQVVDGTSKSATFKQNALGQWHVMLVAEFEMPDTPLPPVDPYNVVGVDLGLKDFAVMSDGASEPAPKFFRKAQRKLARAQRVLARRQLRSNRRRKAKLAVAKIHNKIANKRSDFIHKLTTRLVRNYEGICIEDLNVKGLAKTKLAKSVLDAALGMFRRQLEYKTVWNRKWLAVIDRWFASSKTCHVCGCVNESLTLADRIWICFCGEVHDRDFNASLNIKWKGLFQILSSEEPPTLNACGASVSLLQGAEAIGVEARIPCL